MGEIVMVPVPVELLPRVYAVLAEPWSKNDPITSEQGFLAKVFRNSRDDVRQFLLHLAEVPGTWVTFQDMARIIGPNGDGQPVDMAVKHKLRGTLKSLTRTCRKLGRDEWPIDFEKVGGRIRYRMSKENAEILRRLAK